MQNATRIMFAFQGILAEAFHREEHGAHEVRKYIFLVLIKFRFFVSPLKILWLNSSHPKLVTPNVLIGSPVRIPPGFPLTTCGNDELREHGQPRAYCFSFRCVG